jgi:hypothetical protein
VPEPERARLALAPTTSVPQPVGQPGVPVKKEYVAAAAAVVLALVLLRRRRKNRRRRK